MKKQIFFSLFLLTVFCIIPVLAQTDYANQEKLVTEFVKLKNVPACEGKDSVSCIGRKITYKNLMNSIKIYLTRKGSIEFDMRSKYLIITDIVSNVEFLKEIVTTYDYSEIFLVSEDEEEKEEGASCKGFAGGKLN